MIGSSGISAEIARQREIEVSRNARVAPILSELSASSAPQPAPEVTIGLAAADGRREHANLARCENAASPRLPRLIARMRARVRRPATF
jgi:hypothetical protein